MASCSDTSSIGDKGSASEVQFEERPSLLTLPAETRCLMYEHLVEFTGIVSIFSQYEFAENLSRQTIDLLHICQLIRAEVEDYFYANQTFELRSAAALDSFVGKIGPYHASTIRHLQIGTWLSSRAVQGFVHIVDPDTGPFKSLERLTLPYPGRKYLKRVWDPIQVRQAHAAGPAIVELCKASKFVAGLKIYYKEANMLFRRGDLPKLQFVPKSETLPERGTTHDIKTNWHINWVNHEIHVPEDLDVDEAPTNQDSDTSSNSVDSLEDNESNPDSDDSDSGGADLSSDYDSDL